MKILQKILRVKSQNNSSFLYKNRLSLTDQDIILLSYPRSGNSWTRHLIADIILQNYGYQTEPNLPIEVETIIPSIYTQNLAEVQEKKIKLP